MNKDTVKDNIVFYNVWEITSSPSSVEGWRIRREGLACGNMHSWLNQLPKQITKKLGLQYTEQDLILCKWCHYLTISFYSKQTVLAVVIVVKPWYTEPLKVWVSFGFNAYGLRPRANCLANWDVSFLDNTLSLYLFDVFIYKLRTLHHDFVLVHFYLLYLFFFPCVFIFVLI